MQLKKSYCIATNISSNKSATTFGDLQTDFVALMLVGTNIETSM